MAFFILIVLLLLVTPVKIVAVGQWRGDASALLTVRVWGLPFTLRTRDAAHPGGAPDHDSSPPQGASARTTRRPSGFAAG